jgi:hypothetical protein
MKVEVKGLKEDLRTLNRLNPKLRREFGRRIKQIGQPAVDKIQQARPKGDEAPKGFRHGGRTGIQSSKTVIVRTNTRRARNRNMAVGAQFETVGTIVIQSRDAAMAIMDMAGKTNNIQFEGRSRAYPGRPDGHRLVGQGAYMIRKLNQIGPASRIMWKNAEDALPNIVKEMEALTRDVQNEVNRELGNLGYDFAEIRSMLK